MTNLVYKKNLYIVKANDYNEFYLTSKIGIYKTITKKLKLVKKLTSEKIAIKYASKLLTLYQMQNRERYHDKSFIQCDLLKNAEQYIIAIYKDGSCVRYALLENEQDIDFYNRIYNGKCLFAFYEVEAYNLNNDKNLNKTKKKKQIRANLRNNIVKKSKGYILKVNSQTISLDQERVKNLLIKEFKLTNTEISLLKNISIKCINKK